MGSLQDLLTEVPLSAVMKERVALAEQKYEAEHELVTKLQKRVAELERQNAELRAQLPSRDKGSLGAETTNVLVRLFEAASQEQQGKQWIALALGMKENVAQYHLDILQNSGLAMLASLDPRDEYWDLSAEGRRYVVEHGLA